MGVLKPIKCIALFPFVNFFFNEFMVSGFCPMPWFLPRLAYWLLSFSPSAEKLFFFCMTANGKRIFVCSPYLPVVSIQNCNPERSILIWVRGLLVSMEM